MKLEKIKELKISYSEKEVNNYLKRGFVVIKILSCKNNEEIKPCIIMSK